MNPRHRREGEDFRQEAVDEAQSLDCASSEKVTITAPKWKSTKFTDRSAGRDGHSEANVEFKRDRSDRCGWNSARPRERERERESNFFRYRRSSATLLKHAAELC